MAAQAVRLPPLPTIRDLVKLYRLQARKHLSQNFLMDERLTDKIIKQAGELKGFHVVEVGPGPGGLTRSIIRRFPAKLTVIEKDRRFAPTLNMLSEAFAMADGKMDIIYEDVLRLNFSSFLPEESKTVWEEKTPNIYIIGNLPFSVSTPLIIKWLRAISERSGAWTFGRARMILTFQKEVAERLVAPPKDRQRCRLSVMTQAWTTPKLRFLISGSAFVPKPQVDVGVVSFVPLQKPRTDHEFSLFEKVTRHVFSFPRKYSIKGVRTLFPPEYQDELPLMMYKLSDLDPEMRPTELAVEDIHRLCSAYKYLIQKHPDIRDYNYRDSRRLASKKYTSAVEIEEYVEDKEYNEDDEECSENVDEQESDNADRSKDMG